MFKTLLTALTLFSLTGCSFTVHPPKIEVLDKVQEISIEIDKGCICKEDAKNIFNLVKQLRKSESYYIEQITNYNETFTGE